MAGRLHRLSGIRGFAITKGDPDIRGWEVRTLAGVAVGKVDDLLVDQHRGEVVMIDIDLSDSDQHVHLPIRGVQIERDRQVVIVDSGEIRAAQESMLKDPDNVDRHREDYRPEGGVTDDEVTSSDTPL
ncbi:MAG TPA: PRC-barrel domain-containing protein [Longimicrobiales bacterium]|nr:PRC-barrel domain-containing protein [Longimicrobiales bacterium]